jgi:NADH-quinone oxidoreductase subunit A
MTALVGYLTLFVVIAVAFVLVHLLIGKLIRPARPSAEKMTIYECGEPTIGSAWIQFDLRFYVIALLFVVFDVEVAFFFPWAVVFGGATRVANESLPTEQRVQAFLSLAPASLSANVRQWQKEILDSQENIRFLRRTNTPENQAQIATLEQHIAELQANINQEVVETLPKVEQPARWLAWLAFADILVFFGVLLVGYAYLWRRGDLVWVRSTAAEQVSAAPSPKSPAPTAAPAERQLVGASH